MAGKNILFVGHEATRTGAPTALLTFLRWLRANEDWKAVLLQVEGGELMDEFQKVVTVQLMDRKQPRGQVTLPFKPDLIYFNTISSALIGPRFPVGLYPMVCHLHELECTIRLMLKLFPIPDIFKRFNRFIACADIVRNNLVENHAIPNDQIDVVHEFIPVGDFETSAKQDPHAASLRRTLGITPDSLIVGCVGHPDWRKGSDIFVLLARTILERAPGMPVYFVWLGGTTSINVVRFQHDIDQMPQLNGRVFHVPTKSDPVPYLAGFDLFVLPSREDPFPLVCLEAAACGKPIVCFEKGGGMPEFVQNDAGIIVPYLDIEAMADAVIRLLRDPTARSAIGQTALKRVREKHDVAVASPLILRSISSVIDHAK